MPAFHVHLDHAPREPGRVDAMRQNFPHGVSLTTEGEPPRETVVLIQGRPSAERVDALHKLKHIVIPFAGLPPETRKLAQARPHLSVHNLHHNAQATAEMAIALLMAAGKRVLELDRTMRDSTWRTQYGTNASIPSNAMLFHGGRAVVLGYGHIGQHVAKVLLALGMHVHVVRNHPVTSTTPRLTQHDLGDLNDELAHADALIVTLPLTSETRDLVGHEQLQQMPDNSLVVNVGRGPVINEAALYKALTHGPIGAAGLDVWWRYPKADDADPSPGTLPWRDLPNLVMTPHHGGGLGIPRLEGRRDEHLVELIHALARGDMLNRIDVESGY